jgi:hypothetical protein
MHSVLALSIADVFISIGSFHENLEDASERIEFCAERTLLDPTGEYSAAMMGTVNCRGRVECRII